MGHAAHTAENKKTYRVLVKKPEGKRQHGRSRHRWEDNITMDVKEIVSCNEFIWLRAGACGGSLVTDRGNCAKTILIPK